MHAIKMQTEIGREISEKGIVPELPYFGPHTRSTHRVRSKT